MIGVQAPPSSRRDRWRRWAREARQLSALPLERDPSVRVGRLYDIVGTSNLFGESTLFINLGYWRDQPATLDEASRELARLVGREGALGPGDVQLDVGCGFGDQDMLWVSEFGPSSVTGVNVSAEQIAVSTRRVAEAGMTSAIRFVRASAVALPAADGSCTKVTALESAFHFPSGSTFFAEAFRVLAPCGRLVTADIVPRASVRRYRRSLQAAGFAAVNVQSIRNDVYPPLVRFLRRRARDADTQDVNPMLRWGSRGPLAGAWTLPVDYVIAVASKAPSRRVRGSG